MTPVLDRADVIAAAHMAGRRAAHARHAGQVLDPPPDPHQGPLLVRQAATAWHRGFAEVRAELAKAAVPSLVKVGPHGYIHGWIFVGIPGVGDTVQHPQHGPGQVTGVEGGKVTVRFHRDGAERSFEHQPLSGASHFRPRPAPAGHPASEPAAPSPAAAGRTYTGLVHFTPSRNAEGIRRYGFQASQGGGKKAGVLGAGTYFQTSQSEADQILGGYRANVGDDLTQVHAQATVRNPFVVHATSDDDDPGEAMQRALEAAGLAAPGEKPTPARITSRLKRRGYDAVEVKQDGFNDWFGGSQLVVFDHSNAKVTDSDGNPLEPDTSRAPRWQDAYPAGDGDEETAKRLTVALHSGLVDSTEPSTTGVQASTSIDTFGDGSRWIHKQYDPFAAQEEPAETMTARDLLASRLADAVGAESPHVIRTAPGEIYEPFVDNAKPAVEMRIGAADVAKMTPAGNRIGLFDALTGHQDRHTGNVMIKANGDPVAIDNNSAWTTRTASGDLVSWSPFTQWLLSEYGWGRVPISTAELDQIRPQVEALKPEFDKVAADFTSLADEVDYDTSSMPPEQMYPATLAALDRIRSYAADAEAKAAAS